jgi:enamine deaminase RidA (YjgF/YER057c/UK114 family)
MVADDKSLPLEGQTMQALEKIDALLRSLGSDAKHILSTMNYVTDLGRKAELNAAWLAFFGPTHLPTRATVGVAQLGPGTLIEIVTIAALIDSPPNAS